jgi:hypothetical protein
MRAAMGPVNTVASTNLSEKQFEVVQAKLMTVCDRMCDAQVLDLADALHEVIRARQRIRCQHSRVGGGLRLGESQSFQS